MDPPDVASEPSFWLCTDQMRAYIRPCGGVTAMHAGPRWESRSLNLITFAALGVAIPFSRV